MNKSVGVRLGVRLGVDNVSVGIESSEPFKWYDDYDIFMTKDFQSNTNCTLW